MTIYIDFLEIGDEEDFYAQLKEKAPLPEHFEEHVKALTDVIAGGISMPLHLEFVNMNVEQLEIFEDLLTALEDLEEVLEAFTFAYYLEQYEEE